MKTLSALLVMVALCSCHKEINLMVDSKKQPGISAFATMLSKEKTYIISDYYKDDQHMAIPDVNREDTYTFDGIINDGWVSSKVPCVEYHYNFKVYTKDDSIQFEWVNFQISPQTYTVSDYKTDEWFVLKSGDTYTRYELIN